MDEDDHKLVIKEEPESQYEEDANVSAASSCDYSLSQFKNEPKLEDEEAEEQEEQEEQDDSDEDVPLVSSTV